MAVGNVNAFRCNGQMQTVQFHAFQVWRERGPVHGAKRHINGVNLVNPLRDFDCRATRTAAQLQENCLRIQESPKEFHLASGAPRLQRQIVTWCRRVICQCRPKLVIDLDVKLLALGLSCPPETIREFFLNLVIPFYLVKGSNIGVTQHKSFSQFVELFPPPNTSRYVLTLFSTSCSSENRLSNLRRPHYYISGRHFCS